MLLEELLKISEQLKDEIGGHGINLVKSLSKKQLYVYKNHQSIITLIF